MKMPTRMILAILMTIGFRMTAAPARAAEEMAPAKITGKDFPELDLKNPALTQYCGLQFGEGPEEVVYFAFAVRKVDRSSKGQESPPEYDMLYVYTPNTPPFQTPKLLRGRPTQERMESGRLSGKFMSYPPIKLQTRKGNTIINLDLELVYRYQRPGGRMEISMLHEGRNMKFTHELGKWYGQAAEAPIRPKVVLGEPKLIMRILDGGRSVSAILTLGAEDRPLMPVNAAVTPVMLTVKDGERVVDSRKMRIDKEVFAKGGEFMECRLGRLPPGRTYTYEVSVDLGPLGKHQVVQEYSVDAK